LWDGDGERGFSGVFLKKTPDTDAKRKCSRSVARFFQPARKETEGVAGATSRATDEVRVEKDATIHCSNVEYQYL
jgi:hypothetical protein